MKIRQQQRDERVFAQGLHDSSPGQPLASPTGFSVRTSFSWLKTPPARNQTDEADAYQKESGRFGHFRDRNKSTEGCIIRLATRLAVEDVVVSSVPPVYGLPLVAIHPPSPSLNPGPGLITIENCCPGLTNTPAPERSAKKAYRRTMNRQSGSQCRWPKA